MSEFKHLTNLPVVKPATMPKNAKQEDWLLNTKEMLPRDCELLDKILGRLEEQLDKEIAAEIS